MSDFSKNTALEYIWIRNDIEHHKNIAKKDVKIKYKKLDTIIENKEGIDKEISKPTTVNTGEKIFSSFTIKERNIKKGEVISLSEEGVEWIVFTIESFIAPEIAKHKA